MTDIIDQEMVSEGYVKVDKTARLTRGVKEPLSVAERE
jgi:hypothetical protein